jgi:cytochrome c-type protein NapB
MTGRFFASLGPLAAALVVGLGLAAASNAQDGKAVKGLREAPLTETSAAPEVLKQQVPAGGFGRAYRQQPPLVPHKVEGYEIAANNNQCMDCHDWPGNTRVNAPKISETHYVDRQGVRLDKVAGTRYFCNQCHVPQLDAKPLVGSAFVDATKAK